MVDHMLHYFEPKTVQVSNVLHKTLCTLYRTIHPMVFQGQLQEVVIVLKVGHLETNENHFWMNL